MAEYPLGVFSVRGVKKSDLLTTNKRGYIKADRIIATVNVDKGFKRVIELNDGVYYNFNAFDIIFNQESDKIFLEKYKQLGIRHHIKAIGEHKVHKDPDIGDKHYQVVEELELHLEFIFTQKKSDVEVIVIDGALYASKPKELSLENSLIDYIELNGEFYLKLKQIKIKKTTSDYLCCLINLPEKISSELKLEKIVEDLITEEFKKFFPINNKIVIYNTEASPVVTTCIDHVNNGYHLATVTTAAILEVIIDFI